MADPLGEERLAVRGEEAPVVVREQPEGHLTSVRQPDARRHPGAGRHARMAHMGPHPPEAGPAVVLLLLHHSVEADVPVGEVVHRGVPHADAVPLPADCGAGDVEPEEAEVRAVSHGGDRGHGFAVELPEEEPPGVRGVEEQGIGKPRVPSLVLRPVGEPGHARDTCCGHLERRQRSLLCGVVAGRD